MRKAQGPKPKGHSLSLASLTALTTFSCDASLACNFPGFGKPHGMLTVQVYIYAAVRLRMAFTFKGLKRKRLRQYAQGLMESKMCISWGLMMG